MVAGNGAIVQKSGPLSYHGLFKVGEDSDTASRLGCCHGRFTLHRSPSCASAGAFYCPAALWPPRLPPWAAGARWPARTPGAGDTRKTAERFEVTLSDDAWRQKLSPAQYAVLRNAATERPFSSPLNDEHRNGIFACAGCQLDLFSSKTKFDSGTGWPSFWAPLEHAVAATEDRAFGMLRTEVHCRRCGGHLGHVSTTGRSRPACAIA